MSRENLYSLLGVTPDALPAEIRRAYRQKAKALHPDAGASDRDAWTRLAEAHDVLMDLPRRQHYDRTGEIVPIAPDNSLVPLMTQLSTAFSGVIGVLIKDGLDPAGGDMVGAMKKLLEQDKEATVAGLAKAEQSLAKIKRVSGRFTVSSPDTGPNRLEAVVVAAVEDVERQAQSLRAKLPAIDAALLYLSYASYKQGR